MAAIYYGKVIRSILGYYQKIKELGVIQEILSKIALHNLIDVLLKIGNLDLVPELL